MARKLVPVENVDQGANASEVFLGVQLRALGISPVQYLAVTKLLDKVLLSALVVLHPKVSAGKGSNSATNQNHLTKKKCCSAPAFNDILSEPRAT